MNLLEYFTFLRGKTDFECTRLYDSNITFESKGKLEKSLNEIYIILD